MMKLFAFIAVIIVSTITVEADDYKKTPGVTEPIPLLLWAALDPKEDTEVAKIDAAAFYLFTEKHRQEFLDYYNRKNIIGITRWLHKNAEESGTKGVIWTKVFAKVIFKTLTRQTEEKEHGVPSLAAWAVRNTGVGTDLADVDRTKLVSFILTNKATIQKYINSGDVDGLIKYLEDSKTESGANGVDWKTVVHSLKENRKLFKFSCGFLQLQLCDKSQS